MGTRKKTSPPAKVPALVPAAEAAALLKCSGAQLEQYVQDGRLEGLEKEEGTHYRRKDLLALLAELDGQHLGHPHPFPVVGIGASAGGLEAVTALLDELPPDLGMAYVFISHLSPDHESLLPEILARHTKMPVHKVEHGMRLQPDHVFILPPNTTMYVVDSVLTLFEPRIRSEKGFHPINDFFIALSEVYQQDAVGIILSGTASDGTLGLKAIRASGGWTFTQDDTARFKEMPRNAREAGAVDFVLPPDQIARQLVALRKNPVARQVQAHEPLESDMQEIHRILVLLHKHTGVDFSQYKQSTINRRILRRMLLHKQKDLGTYAALLADKEQEVKDLYHDLLINVTAFFREPTFYTKLKDLVLPAIFANRERGNPVRIWVAGCSTGEESISIAITLLEHFGEQLAHTPVQIFSTDLDDEAVAMARQGSYTRSAVEGLSPARLSQYFAKADGAYKVIKPIRDMCVFAQHDLLRDPPFSRMDLITCQNVLIYLTAGAQQKVLRSFHYAMQPEGFLALGRSETTNSASDLFHLVDKDARLYGRKGTPVPLVVDMSLRKEQQDGRELPELPPPPSNRRSLEGRVDQEMDRLLLHRHIPASILVNRDLDIVRFRGATAPFMAPHTGRASLNLLKMIREDLVFELRALMRRVKEEQVPVIREGLELLLDGTMRLLSVEVVPMSVEARMDHYLIVFREEGTELPRTGIAEANADTDVRDKRIIQLEREIRELREQIRVVSEEAEASTEELQTANEEVLSSNEELQSMNEELETSKEELQSTNEELSTINDELQNRNEELKEARDYAQTIIGTLGSPLVIVNGNMRVLMANKAFYRMFHTTAEETEGMLIHELGNHQWEVAALRKQLFDVLSRGIEMNEFEVQHTFPSIGDRIIQLNARRVERSNMQHRILITMEDVTERRRAEEAVERLAAIVSSSADAIIGLDLQGKITSWNTAASALFGYSPEDAAGRSLDLLLPDRELRDAERLKDDLLKDRMRQYETQLKRRDGSLVDVAITVSSTKLANGKVVGISQIIRDITGRKRHERELLERDRMYQAIGTSINYGIFVCDADGHNVHSSESFLKLIGLTQEECSAMGWSNALHPDDAQAAIVSWRRSVKEGSPWASEHRYKGTDGNYYTVLARGVPYRDEQGQLKGWVGINLDITEQKRMEAALRESEQRFQMLADNMDQLAWISKPDGTEIWMNRRWSEFTGIPPERVREKMIDIIHPGHYHRVVTHIRAKQEKGEAWEDTFPMKDAGGNHHWFLARAVPLRNAAGEIINWFGTSTNITDRINSEEELRRMDRTKDHFLATLAHELRNPLAPLRSGVEVLSFSAGEEDTVRTTCAIMERQVGQMVRLIDDLMDVGRISTGRLILKKDHMDLGNAADVAIEAVEPIMRQKRHRFTVRRSEGALPILGDAARATQIISNLLHNAAKYTDPGGEISLELERDGSFAVIHVKDSGTGIDPQMQARVFDMFTQIDQEQRSQRGGGLGIGLHIVQRLVHMHGGSIEVSSAGKGKGSTFTVRLPLDEQQPARSSRRTGASAMEGRRILLVDDEPDGPLMLSKLLGRLGCETRLAHSGEEAVAMALEFRPEIILMDLSMPGMDGYEACRQIRDKLGAKTRIYALTGWGHELDKEQTVAAGFDDLLVKPVERATLERLLTGEQVRTEA
jgi:two-component system, chemotaxis family, CheB/CheR fusion protein